MRGALFLLYVEHIFLTLIERLVIGQRGGFELRLDQLFMRDDFSEDIRLVTLPAALFVVKAAEIAISGVILHIVFEASDILDIQEIHEIHDLHEDHLARHHRERGVPIPLELALVDFIDASDPIVSEALVLAALTYLQLDLLHPSFH